MVRTYLYWTHMGNTLFTFAFARRGKPFLAPINSTRLYINSRGYYVRASISIHEGRRFRLKLTTHINLSHSLGFVYRIRTLRYELITYPKIKTDRGDVFVKRRILVLYPETRALLIHLRPCIILLFISVIAVHPCTWPVRVFRPFGRIEATLENMKRWKIKPGKCPGGFSRRSFRIRLIRRNGSSADIAPECAFRDCCTTCNVIYCQNRVFSTGSECVPPAHLPRNVGMRNGECTSPHRGIRMSQCKTELSRHRSSDKIRGPLLILQETVQYIHLLTPRQRDGKCDEF